MLAPHFIQLLTSSRPAAIARIKPLVNTPFVVFFAVNTLRDTKRLFEAGRLIGIELLDHIIIGRKENGDSYGYAYYSMKEQGLLTTV